MSMTAYLQSFMKMAGGQQNTKETNCVLRNIYLHFTRNCQVGRLIHESLIFQQLSTGLWKHVCLHFLEEGRGIWLHARWPTKKLQRLHFTNSILFRDIYNLDCKSFWCLKSCAFIMQMLSLYHIQHYILKRSWKV